MRTEDHADAKLFPEVQLPAEQRNLEPEREVIRCPICYHPIPLEHMKPKLQCRRCGYLESCCNPY